MPVLILKLGLPIMLAEMVVVLYNIVDRAYIGHMGETGTLAITGLGVCFPLITFISAFANLCSTGGTTLEERINDIERRRGTHAKSRYHREAAAAQVLAVVRKMRDGLPGKELRVVVGGDFNTNDDDLEYVSEATLRSFYGAHVRSCFRDLRKDQKVTRPGTNGFPDATFDYILYRGFERIVSRKIYPGAPVSDHNLVALRLR